MNEREAVLRLKKGDIGGLEVLVRRHQAPAVRLAYLITRDAALADDIVQAAFLRAYERIHQFDVSRPFGPWFMRSVSNDAVKFAVRRERHTSLDQLTGEPPSLIDRGLPPEAQLERAETADEVWAALGQLPPTERAAIVQRYFLELSEAEMAAVIGRPKTTVKWRLHAGRKRLRVLLATPEPEVT